MRRNVTSAGPGITVEKIELDPASAPVETPGKPVSGLKEVRLLCNMVIEGEGGKSRLLARGEVVSIDLVAPRWRTTEFIESPTAFSKGKVQLLHDMIVCLPNFDGERTVWRERLFSAHSLIDLKTLPNRIVASLVEGEDFLSSWNEDERRVKEQERKEAVEEFSMEAPDVDIGFATNPHDRYAPDSL